MVQDRVVRLEVDRFDGGSLGLTVDLAAPGVTAPLARIVVQVAGSAPGLRPGWVNVDVIPAPEARMRQGIIFAARPDAVPDQPSGKLIPGSPREDGRLSAGGGVSLVACEWVRPAVAEPVGPLPPCLNCGAGMGEECERIVAEECESREPLPVRP